MICIRMIIATNLKFSKGAPMAKPSNNEPKIIKRKDVKRKDVKQANNNLKPVQHSNTVFFNTVFNHSPEQKTNTSPDQKDSEKNDTPVMRKF